MNITPEIIKALETVRTEVRFSGNADLIAAFDALDDADLFAAVDDAEEEFAEAAEAARPRRDPAEWGDLA